MKFAVLGVISLWCFVACQSSDGGSVGAASAGDGGSAGRSGAAGTSDDSGSAGASDGLAAAGESGSAGTSGSAGNTVGSCVGTPAACAGRSFEQCGSPGCSASPLSCSGMPGAGGPCQVLGDTEADCNAHAFCLWDTVIVTTGICLARIGYCLPFVSQTSCEMALCNWSFECGGVPADCAFFFTPTDCSTQPGCSWQ